MVMFREIREETIWELWIANPFRETSYTEFKEEIEQRTQENTLTKAEKEARALEGMNEALAMLGGGFIGS